MKALKRFGIGLAIFSATVGANASDISWNPPATGTQLQFSSAGSETTYEVTGNSASGIVFLHEGKEREMVSMSVILRLDEKQSMSEQERDAAMSIWPLEPGKKAKFGHSGRGWSSRDDVEVNGIENITVPAGNFDTYRITTAMDDWSGWTGKRQCWYAPEIGFCVKIILESESRRRGRSVETLELLSVKKP